MPNRSQDENDAIMLKALQAAGETGMSLDEIKAALFGSTPASNSLVKKMLDRLRSRGHICVKMGRMGPYYMIAPGH